MDRVRVGLIMPDNPVIPLGGVGVKWQKIIHHLKDKFFFHIIGHSYNLAGTHHIGDGFDFIDGSRLGDIFDPIVDEVCRSVDVVVLVDPWWSEPVIKCYSNGCVTPLVYCLDAAITEAHQTFVKHPWEYAAETVLCSEYYYGVDGVVEGLRNSKVTVVYNGVDASDFQTEKAALPGDQNYKLLFMGRVVPDKNIDTLLSCDLPETDLIIMGSSLHTPPEIAAQLDLRPRCFYLGMQTGDCKSQIINAASAVIVPSRVEPFGIVCLEAMVCKVPLLASYSGGMMHWLPGSGAMNCGVTRSSIENCYREFLALSEGERFSLGVQGWRHAMKFTTEEMAEGYRKVLEGVL